MKRNSHIRHLNLLEAHEGGDLSARRAWQWLYNRHAANPRKRPEPARAA